MPRDTVKNIVDWFNYNNKNSPRKGKWITSFLVWTEAMAWLVTELSLCPQLWLPCRLCTFPSLRWFYNDYQWRNPNLSCLVKIWAFHGGWWNFVLKHAHLYQSSHSAGICGTQRVRVRSEQILCAFAKGTHYPTQRDNMSIVGHATVLSGICS
jgi:hypothetical protein